MKPMKPMTKAEFEKSDKDKKADKKHGMPEGSPMDKKQDAKDMKMMNTMKGKK